MSWIQSAFGSRISPVILFIIVVLAVVFFIAALLHLLLRFLVKQRSAQPQNRPEMSSSGAFQRQLQQLFHLHDSGLDQSHIDALPVFLYKEIMGLKEPFDCAVCLCEFSELDKLRLLPLCSHAFHIDCIDTWLLSNSTCPLCRGVILSPGFSYENPVFVFDDSKEMEEVGGGNGGFVGRDDENSSVLSGKRVFSVRLGKLRSTNVGVVNQENEVGVGERERGGEREREISSSSLDGRRCYSMGSFQYVVADSELQVALCPSGRERERGRHGILDGNGRGRGGQNGNFTDEGDGGGEEGKRINSRAKGESFSVSKIWLWSKKGKFPTSTAAHYSNDVNASLP